MSGSGYLKQWRLGRCVRIMHTVLGYLTVVAYSFMGAARSRRVQTMPQLLSDTRKVNGVHAKGCVAKRPLTRPKTSGNLPPVHVC